MKILDITPLFLVLLAIIYGLHLAGAFPDGINNYVFGPNASIVLPSEAEWAPTWGTVWIILGVIILYIELMKSTRTSDATSIEHAISAVVFVIYLGLWLTQKWANNDVFMILTAMTYVDVVAGFTITITAARRDLSLGG